MRRFYWPKVATDVKAYASCMPCQSNKASTAMAIELLRPLPAPSCYWESVSLDLITGLPVCQGSGVDAIATFVDRCSKMMHVVATRSTVRELARLFINSVGLHGMPHSMVSDRDPRFTGAFWQAFFCSSAWDAAGHVDVISPPNRRPDRAA
jgi:hypothetical protein